MKRGTGRISKREVLKRGRELVKRCGEGVTLAVFRRESGVPQAVVYDLFGSWCELRKALGLGRRAERKRVVSGEGLQARLRELVGTHGEGLTFARFCQLSGYSSQVVVSRFGNWRGLRESIGMSGRVVLGAILSDEELLCDMARVYLKWKRIPGIKSYRRMGGRIAPETIRGRFGGWGQAKRTFREWARRISAEE